MTDSCNCLKENTVKKTTSRRERERERERKGLRAKLIRCTGVPVIPYLLPIILGRCAYHTLLWEIRPFNGDSITE